MVDAIGCRLLHLWLGMEGNAHPGSLQHGDIVGAITHG